MTPKLTRLQTTPEAIDAHRRINRTAVPYPADSSIKELFERCAERVPDAVAVIHRDRSVSYRELNRLANVLAARLRAQGAAPGAAIAVCVERSPELIASLLAVLKCGAAYLPVDRSWPGERLRELFGQADCELLLTDQPQSLARRLSGYRILPVGDLSQATDDGNPQLRADPEAIAYINFTSGSTGRPKGVPIRHRSIARLVFNASYAQLDEEATLLQLAPITFDAATFEIWGALLHGGTCVLYPSGFVRFSELKRELVKHGVTVLFLTTALFNTIVDEAIDTLDGLRRILTGGEAHSLKHMAAALRRLGADRLTSVYGPTESTTFATYHPVRELPPSGTALPIGLPIQNTRAYVVADGLLCAPGETGEILLAGPGLSPGYLGLPDLTREYFVDIEIDGSVERLYRTGDRAYLREDGTLVFQGRLDDQVKVNGYRIEPGEISHHLDHHPDVKQCFVTLGENAAGEKILSVFVVPANAGCTPEAVRGYLAARLPGYMIPSSIRLCEALPLSATGKIDRRALLGAVDPPGAIIIRQERLSNEHQQTCTTVPGSPRSARTRPESGRTAGLHPHRGRRRPGSGLFESADRQVTGLPGRGHRSAGDRAGQRAQPSQRADHRRASGQRDQQGRRRFRQAADRIRDRRRPPAGAHRPGDGLRGRGPA